MREPRKWDVRDICHNAMLKCAVVHREAADDADVDPPSSSCASCKRLRRPVRSRTASRSRTTTCRIRACTERMRQFPRDATAYFHRGRAYLGAGDLDRAIADNTRAIKLDSAYAAAYFKRGQRL